MVTLPFSHYPKTEILSTEGYKNEVHSVITADNYILRLHRIPSAKRNSQPVVIVHAMGTSAFEYVISGPGIPKASSIGKTFALYV